MVAVGRRGGYSALAGDLAAVQGNGLLSLAMSSETLPRAGSVGGADRPPEIGRAHVVRTDGQHRDRPGEGCIEAGSKLLVIMGCGVSIDAIRYG